MFAVYFPGRQGADPAHFAAVGLADVLSPHDAQPSFTDLQPGPDGGRGVAASWDGGVPPIGGHGLEWTAGARGDGKLFWFGRTKGAALSPADLARKRQLRGLGVALTDGNEWLIPIAQQLPCVLGLDAQGQWTGKTDPKYQPYYDACWAFWERLTVGTASVSWSRGADFGATALSVNYRVNRDVAAWLGLLRDDLLWSIAKAALEFDRFLAIVQKKTAEAAPAGTAPGASPSTAPGGSA